MSYVVFSNVIEVSGKMFESTIISSDEIWLVDFYRPGCSACIQLDPILNKFSAQGYDRIKVAKISISEDFWGAKFIEDYKINFVPHLQWFGKNKSKSRQLQTNEELTLITLNQFVYESMAID